MKKLFLTLVALANVNSLVSQFSPTSYPDAFAPHFSNDEHVSFYENKVKTCCGTITAPVVIKRCIVDGADIYVFSDSSAFVYQGSSWSMLFSGNEIADAALFKDTLVIVCEDGNIFMKGVLDPTFFFAGASAVSPVFKAQRIVVDETSTTFMVLHINGSQTASVNQISGSSIVSTPINLGWYLNAVESVSEEYFSCVVSDGLTMYNRVFRFSGGYVVSVLESWYAIKVAKFGDGIIASSGEPTINVVADSDGILRNVGGTFSYSLDSGFKDLGGVYGPIPKDLATFEDRVLISLDGSEFFSPGFSTGTGFVGYVQLDFNSLTGLTPSHGEASVFNRGGGTLIASSYGKFNLDIVDIRGQIVASAQSGPDSNVEIDISGLSTGFYLARVAWGSGGSETRRILVLDGQIANIE